MNLGNMSPIALNKTYNIYNLSRNKSKILQDSNLIFLSCPGNEEMNEISTNRKKSKFQPFHEENNDDANSADCPESPSKLKQDLEYLDLKMDILTIQEEDSRNSEDQYMRSCSFLEKLEKSFKIKSKNSC